MGELGTEIGNEGEIMGEVEGGIWTITREEMNEEEEVDREGEGMMIEKEKRKGNGREVLEAIEGIGTERGIGKVKVRGIGIEDGREAFP